MPPFIPIAMHSPSVVAALPAPPVIDRLLFESPIVAPIVALVVALVAAAALTRQGKGRAGLGSACLGLIVALGLALTARLVTTPREQIEACTLDFVDAVMAADADRVDQLLSPRLVLHVDGNDIRELDARQYIVGQVDMVHNAFVEHARRVVQSIADSPASGRVRFSVRGTPRNGGLTFTVWQAEWRRDTEGRWRLATLDWKKLNGQTPSAGALRSSQRIAP